jgi:hypothetical protein
LAHAQDLDGSDYTNLTRLADGRILLWGGRSCDQLQTVCNSVSEIYNSSVGPNGTFTPTQAVIPFGWGSTATLLPNGQVLFAGGEIETANTGSVPSNAAGLYDPVADTFVSSSSMAVARDGATAVLLGNGGVLISGGRDNSNSVVASAEIYDPSTGAFQPTAHPMTSARLGHTATLLADGQHVLIVGGQAATWLDSAELYDATTDTFTSTGSMTVARSAFTSTLLVGGAVLVVGSPDLPGVDPSADLYMP